MDFGVKSGGGGDILREVEQSEPLAHTPWDVREFGNRERRRRKTKSLIRVVYKLTHTLLDFNCLLKYQSFI